MLDHQIVQFVSPGISISRDFKLTFSSLHAQAFKFLHILRSLDISSFRYTYFILNEFKCNAYRSLAAWIPSSLVLQS